MCVSLRFIRLSTNLEYIGVAAFRDCELTEAVFLPPTIISIGYEAFYQCKSLRFIKMPDAMDHIGFDVFQKCDLLSSTVRNNRDDNDLPMHKVCYSTSVNPQMINEYIDTHGIERGTEVNDQQTTALHILCVNPHVTGDAIRAYLQLAAEAAEQQDSVGMTPFQYLCRNYITFFDERNFSSMAAWWYGCMP